VAGGSFYSSTFVGEFVSDFLGSFYKWETGAGTFGSVTKWLSTILTGLAFLFLLRYILLIVLAPLMSFLSEEVEEKYTGTSLNQGFNLARAGKEMIRGVRMAIRNMSRELFLTDYYLERHMGMAESARTVKQNRGLAIGNGSIYLGLLLIPVLGVIFGPVLGTISATVQAIEDDL